MLKIFKIKQIVTCFAKINKVLIGKTVDERIFLHINTTIN